MAGGRGDARGWEVSPSLIPHLGNLIYTIVLESEGQETLYTMVLEGEGQETCNGFGRSRPWNFINIIVFDGLGGLRPGSLINTMGLEGLQWFWKVKARKHCIYNGFGRWRQGDLIYNCFGMWMPALYIYIYTLVLEGEGQETLYVQWFWKVKAWRPYKYNAFGRTKEPAFLFLQCATTSSSNRSDVVGPRAYLPFRGQVMGPGMVVTEQKKEIYKKTTWKSWKTWKTLVL